MNLFILLLTVLTASICLYSSCLGKLVQDELAEEEEKYPSIGISILVKDKAHSLPYALTCLQQLHYPKNRLYIWFYIDDCEDKSVSIINAWKAKHKSEYSNVYVIGDTKPKTAFTTSVPNSEWTEEKLKHIIHLREKAMNFAKKQWADYIFMLDADVFLTDPSTLKQLISKKLPIVAPMLVSDGLYSNFWAAMTPTYYYEKTDEYESISNRDTVGCFEVPMVHSAVLIDLRPKTSVRLTYDPYKIQEYDGPVDDIIAFAISAKRNGIPMTVCNDLLYGFIPVPMDMNHTGIKTTEEEQLLNVKLEALSQGLEFPLDPELEKFVTYPLADRLGVDRVFLINLKRRPERRHLMQASLRALGIDADLVTAVDGRDLDLNDLSEYGVTLMPKYEDPYHKRPMKAGEIGCFLSHYGIWKEIAARHIPRSLVLEDDVRFVPFFRRRFNELLNDLEGLDWELVYIGRKVLDDKSEEYVTRRISRPRYSYWTLGYILSEAGARRLIQAEPLSKMLPVDELLPIMFDQHPNDTWKSFFRRRELKAFSAAPLLVYPTHYTGDDGYVSDTEDSEIIAVPQDERVDIAARAPRPVVSSHVAIAIAIALIIINIEIICFVYTMQRPNIHFQIFFIRTEVILELDTEKEEDPKETELVNANDFENMENESDYDTIICYIMDCDDNFTFFLIECDLFDEIEEICNIESDVYTEINLEFAFETDSEDDPADSDSDKASEISSEWTSDIASEGDEFSNDDSESDIDSNISDDIDEISNIDSKEIEQVSDFDSDSYAESYVDDESLSDSDTEIVGDNDTNTNSTSDSDKNTEADIEPDVQHPKPNIADYLFATPVLQ